MSDASDRNAPAAPAAASESSSPSSPPDAPADAPAASVEPSVTAAAETSAAPQPEGPTPPPPALDDGAEGPRWFRPRRPGARDLGLTVGGVLGLALLMTRQGHLRAGVWLGALLTLVTVLGLLGVLGDSPLDLRGDEREADEAEARPWYRREGVWVLLFGAVLYLPFAGAYGLWDPWETHYSEVSREILSRDDWITTWWGQEGWFMSKPILIFWMGALGMGAGTLFGLNIGPDGGPQWQEWCIRVPISMLAIAAMYALYRAIASAWGRRAGLLVAMVLGTMPHWFFLAHQAMTDMPFVGPLVIAMAMLMLAVTAGDRVATARRFHLGGRAVRLSLWHGAIGSTLAMVVPQVMYLLTRPMVVSCPEDSRMAQCQDMLRQNRIGSFQFPVETYYYGSAGNSADTLANSVPGSPAWERLANVVPFFPSVVQGVMWLAVGGLAMGLLRRERRAKDLFFSMFYVWCAVATIGKGPAGLAIPVAVAGAWIVVSGRWREITRARLFTGALLFLVVGMPWYIAITGRLGNEFFDRFVVHDIINRTVVGVHGDTGSVRYFIWQLGYATFPWSGLVPVALVSWRQLVPAQATQAQRDIARIGMLWFVVAFVLFSAMITKFHHYIFPAVPGAAILVGLLLDRMLGTSQVMRAQKGAGSVAALFAGVAALVLGVGNFFGSVRGAIPRGAEALPPGSKALGGVLIAVAFGLVALSWRLADDQAAADDTADASKPASTSLVDHVRGFFTLGDPSPASGSAAAESPARYGTVSHGALAVFAAGVVAFVARDLAYHGQQRPPGYQRLLQLFTYQYERMWPSESFDYHPIMIGFGVAVMVVSAAMVVHRLRAQATRAMLALGACFAVWALDVYMIDVSRHWSQRGLFERYYQLRQPRPESQRREGEDVRYTHDPVGAYMMNWKGENFYTGGRSAMLDCGDLPFCSNRARQWILRRQGQRVYFVTERTHGGSIVSIANGAGFRARELTDAWDQNKFVLVEALPQSAAPAP